MLISVTFHINLFNLCDKRERERDKETAIKPEQIRQMQ